MSEHQIASSHGVRRQRLVEMLEQDGERGVEELAATFGVSGMTIRRDLQELAEEGRVIRTHGGAVPAPRISFEFRFLERAEHRAAAKEAIAQAAAGLVQPGQSVLLDSGTTTLAIARRLRQIPRLTVVTTSLPIASELFGLDNIELILLGGTLRKDAPDLTGSITQQNLEVLHTDVAFIGADAVATNGTLYTASPELGQILKQMAACAGAAYAVVDSAKIGRRGLMRFGHLRDWQGLICDEDLPRAMAKGLGDAGANVIVAAGKVGSRS